MITGTIMSAFNAFMATILVEFVWSFMRWVDVGRSGYGKTFWITFVVVFMILLVETIVHQSRHAEKLEKQKQKRAYEKMAEDEEFDIGRPSIQ